MGISLTICVCNMYVYVYMHIHRSGSDCSTGPYVKFSCFGSSNSGQLPYELQSMFLIVEPYDGRTKESLYRDFIVGPARVLFSDPCPCGLPEILTIASLTL